MYTFKMCLVFYSHERVTEKTRIKKNVSCFFNQIKLFANLLHEQFASQFFISQVAMREIFVLDDEEIIKKKKEKFLANNLIARTKITKVKKDDDLYYAHHMRAR